MSLAPAVIVALALLVLAVMAWVAVHALSTARRLRGPRVVSCPETGCAAAVSIDVRRAFATALIEYDPQIRLGNCSRWVTRGQCAEPCRQDAAAPANTTRAIVERAVQGRPCAFCGKTIEHAAFLDHYAAFLQGDDTTIEWPEVAPERLPETIRANPPVCWNCHVAETFRRKYPELVTDRPWRRA
jgi:hypothetical protein